MQNICDQYIPGLRLKFVELDCQELLAVVADVLGNIGHADEEPSPSQSPDQQAPPSLGTIASSTRGSSLPSLPDMFASSSTLAAQLPHVTPFERLLACNKTFPDPQEIAMSPRHSTALVQATYDSPGAGGPQGTYHEEGTAVPVPGRVPFRPPTHRLVHDSTRATVPLSSVFKTDNNNRIPNFGGVITAPKSNMGIHNPQFEPVFTYPGLWTYGEQPLHQSANPVTHQIGHLVTTQERKQKFRCGRRPYGCQWQTDHPGDIRRHEEFACKYRNEIEIAYGDSQTTCRLCPMPRQFSRLDRYREHVRKNHPMFIPSLGRRERRTISATTMPVD